MARDESYRLEDWRDLEVWYEVEVRLQYSSEWVRFNDQTFKHEAAAEAFLAILLYLGGFPPGETRVARYFRDMD